MNHRTIDPCPAACRRAIIPCGAIATGLGLMALAGWATGNPVLLGLRAEYIPMAPNTALAFVTLGIGLVALAIGRERLAAGLAVPVGMVVGVRLLEFAGRIDGFVDRLFLRVPSARFGLAPLGEMALYTAIGFLAASLAMIASAMRRRRKWAGDVCGVGALVAGGVGLVFSLGYLFSPNDPLMYGTEAIPMALNTALGFLALGAGLTAAAGPASFPLRPMCGGSTRARLFRVFLPLVVATVVFVAWFTRVVSEYTGPSSAAITTGLLALAAILIFGSIGERIARRVGADLERAEAELRRAHDLLEVVVEERTRELRAALDDLRQSHEELQAAHRGLKDAQARMLQQAKMASLGQTAAGVAHEINNPLAFVTSNFALLRREVAGIHDIVRLYQEAEHTLDEYERDLMGRIRAMAAELDLPYVLGNLDGLLERSREGLRRIQKIVSDLRDFAHLEGADEGDTDLNAGIAAIVSLMRGVGLARGITLEADLGAIPTVWCSAAKINMVIQNLVTNAFDASAPGGSVVVSTRTDGDGVRIDVRDHGTGIDPAILDRIFDPFFTTKPIGQGTGLGLAMSFGIIRDHGGTIEVDSTPGAGSTFTIRLPTSPEKPIDGATRGRGPAKQGAASG